MEQEKVNEMIGEEEENEVIEGTPSPIGSMELTYAYKTGSGEYSLTVNKSSVEVIRDLFRAKAAAEIISDEVDNAYGSLRAWKKLDELLSE